MPSPTLTALAGFIAWSLVLLVWMELLRVRLVATKQVPANGFLPDNANLSPFMQRLARAHANCLEGLPIFGGLMLLAVAAGRVSVTDPLAPWLLLARIAQSSIHLASTSVLAVNLRFLAFCIQLAIGCRWCWQLLVA